MPKQKECIAEPMDNDKVIEIRWHGRGGQGAVTSAELVATAVIREGKYAQAMPSFGPERRGAPVLAFNRVSSNAPIRARAPVTEPDVVVVLSTDLLNIMDVTAGLKQGGALVINSPKYIDDLKPDFGGPWKLAVVNGTAIAREILGVPIVNTTMIGALLKATGIFNLTSLEEPLKERFGPRAKNNINACQRAYNDVMIVEPVAVSAGSRKSFQTEKLLKWQEISLGCVITEPGNASEYRTGDWKSQHPEYVYEKCNKCGLCYIFCPEGCIEPKDDGYYNANLYYCKGCGLCAKECPKKAINMIEES
jgi:pyruvate ferredoxin oxidoreductase gamma subunit